MSVTGDGITSPLRVFYRASGLGSCIRALVLSRRGVTGLAPPDKMLLRYNDGHLHEPQVLAKLAEHFDVRDTGGTVVLGISDKIMVRGHIDALGVKRSGVEPIAIEWPSQAMVAVTGNVVLEVKAFADSTFKTWREKSLAAFDSYQWQISAYMHALALPALFAIKNKNSGEILYTYVPVPPKSMNQIRARVATAEAMALQTEIMPECIDPLDYPCPYYRHHDAKKPREAVVVDADTTTDLITLAMSYDIAREEEKKWKERKEAARDTMREIVGVGHEAEAGEFVVSVSASKRSTFQREAFEREHPEIELADYYKDVPTTPTVNVKKG